MRLRHQKRFRYGNPDSLVGLFRKYSSVLYFLAAWNVAGMTLWKLYDRRQSKTDTTWDNLNSTEKVIKTTTPHVWETAKVKRYKLFGSKESTKQTDETLED